MRKNYKYMVLAAVVAVIVGILVILWQMGDPPSEADRIYTNVYIHGVAVGGMNREEAQAALMQRFQTGLDARVVNYYVEGEVVATFTFAEFGVQFDFNRLIDDAMDYSHMSGFRRQIARVFGAHEISAPPLFGFSVERLEDNMKTLSQKVDVVPQNATFYEDANTIGKIVIQAEKVGYGVDVQAAAAATREVIHTLSDGNVNLRLIQAAPAYTSATFDFEPKVLGFYETPCLSSGDEPRRRNVIIAAERINNKVIFPNQIFSAGEIIAANNPDIGYETAVVLVDGEPSEDIGGGVCQVVTTLYNAVLRAELEVIQRHNHSARVSYVEIGFDATVAGDYFDLKFRNTTPYPILITSRVQNEKLYVRIYGHETREDGRSLRFEVRKVELIPPEPYREVVDPEIPRGERWITLESQIGYHVELYKIVYMDGNQVEQVKINTSMYKPLQGVIAIGAG